MLILSTTPKLLMPVPKSQWRDPSAAQFKDAFGNPGVQVRFRLSARLNDGHVKWKMWFDSRDDADQFLWSLGQYLANGVPIPREDWDLPNEVFGDPELYPGLSYAFDTVTFLVTTGSNQTFLKPDDWNNADNLIEVVSAGGSGGRRNTGGSLVDGHASGGGGGLYSAIADFTMTGSVTYRVAAGVADGSATSAGKNGESSWWNDTVDPGVGSDNTKASAQGGRAGATSATSVVGGAGGAAASSWGQIKWAGGRGGNHTNTGGNGATGGGGAGGPAAAGGNGGDSSSGGLQTNTAGGSSEGGTRSGGSAPPANGAGNAGQAGVNWDATHGLGAGGSGASNGDSSAKVSGGGGLYGGASGGGVKAGGSGGTSAANSAQGIVVVTYAPSVTSGNFFLLFGA